MIARCPECQSCYRVSREKLGPRGARLRCIKCSSVFVVRAPARTAASPPAKGASPPAREAPRRPSSPSAAGVGPRGRALIAEADAALAKRIAGFLARWGVRADLVDQGGEALLRIFRKPPDLAILGGHLPGLGAAAIAEVVRRSAELHDVRLVRVAPLDEPPSAPEFDADRTLEPADLPDGLASVLEELGLEPPAPESAHAPAPAPAPAARATRPAARRGPASPATASDPGVAKAERLARIIVSDIILYSEERFVRGIEEGNVADALAAEIEEGRGLFHRRIPADVRAQRDFIVEELKRRAAARSGRS